MLAHVWMQDVHRYLDFLREHFGSGLTSVVLFGSWARGTALPESDIDLLVVASGLPARRSDRHRLLYGIARRVSGEFASTVAPIVATPEEAARVKPYYLGMLSGHMMLWDTDGFFGGVLDQLRRRLTELGARRYVDDDGYEFWDLKPDWKPGDVVSL